MMILSMLGRLPLVIDSMPCPWAKIGDTSLTVFPSITSLRGHCQILCMSRIPLLSRPTCRKKDPIVKDEKPCIIALIPVLLLPLCRVHCLSLPVCLPVMPVFLFVCPRHVQWWSCALALYRETLVAEAFSGLPPCSSISGKDGHGRQADDDTVAQPRRSAKARLADLDSGSVADREKNDLR